MLIELITGIGLCSAVIYLIILLYLAIGIIRTNIEVIDKQPSVSVIVAAHNESKNIVACLDSILNQDYPRDKLEIIVVNDRSQDAMGLILDKYNRNHSQIRVITLTECDPGWSPKKFALTKGINIANGDIIATTDADCQIPGLWLKTIVSYFTSETGMVIGLAPLQPNAWLLSYFACIDALLVDQIAYGTLGYNHAVTCTGRNFAYRKSLFLDISGFSKINHILSGDDDLFMMKVKDETNWKIRFMPDSQAIIFSDAPSGWRHFITQRKRHISASKFFPFPIKVGFGLAFISKFFIMAVFVLSLVSNVDYHLPVVLLLFSYFPTAVLMYVITRKTSQIYLLILYPVWEIYYLISNFILGPMGLFGKISWGVRQGE